VDSFVATMSMAANLEVPSQDQNKRKCTINVHGT